MITDRNKRSLADASPMAVPARQVLHLLSGKERGGIRSVLVHLSAGFQQGSWNTTILSIGRTADHEVPALPEGSKIVRIPRHHKVDIGHFFRMLDFIREARIDIIHTHSIISNLYGLLIRCFLKRVHHIIHVHANLSHELASSQSSSLKRRLLLRGNRWVLKRCSRIIANSYHVKDYLVHGGIDGQKIFVVHNGIDPEQIRARAAGEGNVSAKGQVLGAKTGKIVGTIGRLMPIKNYPLFLRAAGKILEENDDLQFLIIGDGKERKALEELAASLGISGKVTFAGWRENPYPLIAAMDIFVLTSLWEGFGIVLLEAMALEKPVVATKVGAVPEIVRDGVNGILVPSDDRDALARAISMLLRNPSLGDAMGRRGREMAETGFTIEKMMNGIKEVYSCI